MKKKFNKIILIIVLLIIPLNKAKASSINISCPDKVTFNQTIECKITGATDKLISSLSGKISATENIEIIKFTKDGIWQGEGDNKSFDLYTDINKTKNFNIGTITLKIKKHSTTETISINDIYYYDENFKEIAVNKTYKNIKILSNNNNLSKLEVVNHNLTPTFNKNTLEYKLTTSNDEIRIEATKEDNKSTITGTGNKKLKYGTNKFSIIVTSEFGTKKEYILIVTRQNNEEVTQEKPKEELEKPKDNNSKLKSLTITNYNIEFNSNIYTYNIEIDNNTEELDIQALPINENSKITIEGNKNLEIGKNEITITVTSEDNNKTIYKINAIKKGDTCIIENINILNYNFDFKCDKHDYELEIDLEENLNIEVITTNKNAKVNIYNNHDLKHEDIIKIVVKLDDVDYTYNIKVLKSSNILKELFNSKQLITISIVLIFTATYLLVRLIIKRKHKKGTI